MMYGPYLMCAKGVDNGGNVSFTIAADPQYAVSTDCIRMLTADHSEAVLIPYYKRNNRVIEDPKTSAMTVWFPKENMGKATEIREITGDHLYGYYALY